MSPARHHHNRFTTRKRPLWALILGVALAAVAPGWESGDLAPALALAQDADRATSALFLAVERNDLPGVQAAILGGADVDARQLNGMQAVDIAIERGYFDIAHYLITVRNQKAAQQGAPAQPAPTPQQLAQTQPKPETPPPAQVPTHAPAPALPADTPNPFDAPQATSGLPVVGDVRQPAVPPAVPSPAPAQPSTPVAKAEPKISEAALTKPSASTTFFTTFMDFFRPPNTTGIVSKDRQEPAQPGDGVTVEQLNREIQEIDKTLGTIKGPEVPISPEELARELPTPPELPTSETPSDVAGTYQPGELPPYSVRSSSAPAPETPQMSSQDAFGDLEVADVTPADAQPIAGSQPPQTMPTDIASVGDPLPFGGGVDPDILYLLGMSADGAKAPAPAPKPAPSDPFAVATTPADPFASAAPSGDPFAAATPADPFAAPPSGKSETVAGVLQNLGQAKDIKPVEAKRPPSPDGSTPPAADPFAQPSAASSDPFTSSNAPAGSPDQPPDQPQGEVDELAGLLQGVGEEVKAKPDGWDVKAVDGARTPGEIPLPDVAPTGTALESVELALGANTVVGQTVGDDRLKMMEQESIHKPCVKIGGSEAIYCIDKINWDFDLEEDFLVDTIMYQGTRSVSRYDAGRATRFHVLFRSTSLPKIVQHYIARFGQPTEKVERAIAPLAEPRRDNPTYIWRSREKDTDSQVTLEIRQFDDARGEFPDTKRGVIMLYREHAGQIFPRLSQLELMVLKEAGAMDMAPKTPDSVWQ